MQYKLTTAWPKHIESGAFVNPDSNVEYLQWLSEGNTPEPADPPPAPSLKMVGIEFEGVMCSATKEDQTGLMAVLLATQMQGAAFKPTRYDFANGNALVLTKENIAAFAAVWMPFRQGFFTVDV